MDRQPVLEGARLRLRPLRPDDWDALFAVASDREIWAQHPAHDRWQEPVFRRFFAEALAGGGALVALDKATGAVIGSSRWQGYDPADGGSVEIGWTFIDRERWGGGYNPEMKRLMLAHAFRWVERVDFHIGENNFRSRTAMKRIGGHLTERSDEVDFGDGRIVRHVIYAITREGFEKGPLGS